MICLPVKDDSFTDKDVAMFFKGIMFGIQFDQRENYDYVTGIISYLNNGVFSLVEFRNLIDDMIDGNGEKQAKTGNTNSSIGADKKMIQKTINNKNNQIKQQSSVQNYISPMQNKDIELILILKTIHTSMDR